MKILICERLKINAIHWLRNIITNDKTINISSECKDVSTMKTYLIVLKKIVIP